MPASLGWRRMSPCYSAAAPDRPASTIAGRRTRPFPRRSTMSKLFDLSGRVAVVSGAAQGLGRAMALALAEAGADLLLADLNAAGLRDAAEQITRLGRRATPVTCDVSDPVAIRAMFAELDR